MVGLLNNRLVIEKILHHFLTQPPCPCHYEENPIANFHLISQSVHQLLCNDHTLASQLQIAYHEVQPHSGDSIRTVRNATCCSLRNLKEIRSEFGSRTIILLQSLRPIDREGVCATIRRNVMRGQVDPASVYSWVPQVVADLPVPVLTHYRLCWEYRDRCISHEAFLHHIRQGDILLGHLAPPTLPFHDNHWINAGFFHVLLGTMHPVSGRPWTEYYYPNRQPGLLFPPRTEEEGVEILVELNRRGKQFAVWEVYGDMPSLYYWDEDRPPLALIRAITTGDLQLSLETPFDEETVSVLLHCAGAVVDHNAAYALMLPWIRARWGEKRLPIKTVEWLFQRDRGNDELLLEMSNSVENDSADVL